ncbi:hypothetical protein GCM10027055_24470 [Janibacter alkaliphilus]|uniref:4-amino-4-deoxy-L-arabinose transferase n=1 Tax=Janibacter alkaliphilus TaxID=1069963 RepID=A0A852X743_9MICO|nr:hypothetical protein [Janibacter alkaliphilus]NYG38247.1 hypothetical protein [Janibacter alkaliphilus]
MLQLACLLGPGWAFVKAVRIDWTPEGDDAMIALRAMDVFSTSPPVMGQRSTSGMNDPSLASHHLGPLEYYLLAPLGELFGWAPWSIALTMCLLAAACSLITVRGALHLGGPVAACGALGTVLLTQWAIGVEGMFRPFNPYPALLALLAVMVLAWALLVGRWWAAPPFVVLVSLVAQANLAYAPIAVGLGLGTLLLAGVSARRGRWVYEGRERGPYRQRNRKPPRDHVGDHSLLGRMPRPLVWATVLLILCWLPSTVELFLYEPNNATQLYRYATAPDDPRRGLNVEGMLHLLEIFAPGPGGFGQLTPDLTLQRNPAMMLVGVLVILLGVLGCSRVGLRPGRSNAVLPCRVATAGLLGGAVSAALLPTGLIAPYYVALHLPLATFTWFAVLWRMYAAMPGARNRPTTRVRHALTVAAAAAAGLATVTARPIDVTPLLDAGRVVAGADEVVSKTGEPDALIIRGEGGAIVALSYTSAVAFDQHRQGRTIYDQGAWPFPEDFDERRIDDAPSGGYELYISDEAWARPAELQQWSVPTKTPEPGNIYLTADP